MNAWNGNTVGVAADHATCSSHLEQDLPRAPHILCSCFLPFGRFSLMSCVFHRLRHRWFPGLTRKSFLEGLRPPDPPNKSAAVASSEGECLGSCPRLAKISMSSQDDLGQGSACSALAMDPKQMEVRGLRPHCLQRLLPHCLPSHDVSSCNKRHCVFLQRKRCLHRQANRFCDDGPCTMANSRIKKQWAQATGSTSVSQPIPLSFIFGACLILTEDVRGKIQNS